MNKPTLNTLRFEYKYSVFDYVPAVQVSLNANPEFLTTEGVMHDGEPVEVTKPYNDASEFAFQAHYEQEYEVLVNGVTAIYVRVIPKEKWHEREADAKFQTYLPNMLAQSVTKKQKELEILVQPGKVTVRAL